MSPVVRFRCILSETTSGYADTYPRHDLEVGASGDVRPTPVVGRAHTTRTQLVYRRGSKGRLQFKTQGDWVQLDIKSQGQIHPAEKIRLGTTLAQADESPLRWDVVTGGSST